MRDVPVEEMEEPRAYNISLCFDWHDFDSCMTFEIVVDGSIGNKVEMVKTTGIQALLNTPEVKK